MTKEKARKAARSVQKSSRQGQAPDAQEMRDSTKRSARGSSAGDEKSSQARAQKAAAPAKRQAKSAQSKSGRGAKSGGIRQTATAAFQSSVKGARGIVERNSNVQSAGIALAGAGVVALFATPAGRRLVKSAAETVISLVNMVREEVMPHEAEQSEFATPADDSVRETRSYATNLKNQY